MAYVGGQPRVAVDPLLERVDHAVEGADDGRELGIVGRGEPAVEFAAGDRGGGDGDSVQWRHDRPARPRSEDGSRCCRQQSAPEEDAAEEPQSAVELGKWSDLVEVCADGRDRYADDHGRPVVGPEALCRRLTRRDPLTQGSRNGVAALVEGRRVPLAAPVQDDRVAGRGARGGQYRRDVGACALQATLHEDRPRESLVLHDPLPLCQHVSARQQIGADGKYC